MVPLTLLWLPILLSAVLVFVASFIIHMVLGYHRTDMRKLPSEKEDQLLDALRRLNLPPGDYAAPHAGSAAGMNEPAFVAKATKGPIAFMTIAPGGPPSMTSNLVIWFLYSIVCRPVQRVHRGAGSRPRRRLSDGVPVRRRHDVHGLRVRAAAAVDLVPKELGNHAEIGL